MNKGLFVDSNIFIESLKNIPTNRAVELIQLIFSDSENDYFINETVFSEVYYQLIVKGKLTSRQKENDLWEILNVFFFLESNKEILLIARNFIKKNKLKPNDSLILASAIHYKLNGIITLDSDFVEVAKEENIKVISTPDELKSLTRGS
ncbi:PIN domain-containing protein [Persephonella sp.]